MLRNDPLTWLAAAMTVLVYGCTGVLVSASEPGAAGWANVRDFGAKGDGRTDDSQALQRAVDSGVGDVYLPKGVYRLTRPVTLDLDKIGFTSLRGHGVATLEMAGAGPALRLKGTHFKSADPPGFSQNVWDHQRMPLIDGLAIVGAHDEAEGIEASGTMQLTITRTHIRRVLHGIHLVENNRNVIVSNCHIYENRGIGIFYDDVNLHQSNITGCHISYCRQGGIVSRGGNVRNIHIAGCDLESNMGADTPPTANLLIDCRGSKYGTAEVAVTGCTIQHNHSSPNSANIRILGRSERDQGGPVSREGLVTITGNVMSDVFVNIHLQDCRGVVVSGNTIWRGYAHNLLVEDCTNVVVGANNLGRRSPLLAGPDAKQVHNAVVFRGCADCTIAGLHLTQAWHGEAGLLVDHCRRMNISQCSILDCDGAGLLLRDVSDSLVSDCLIRDDRDSAKSVPVKIEGGSGNDVRVVMGTARGRKR